MLLLFVLFGLAGVGYYIAACFGVALLYLAVRFWWVLIVGGVVLGLAART